MKKILNTIFQNRIVLIIVLVIAMAFNRSGSFYSQSWQWAKKAAGTSGDMGSVSCTDQAGNTIATGVYTSNPVQIGTYTLGNMGTGTADAFIAKYDPNGAVLWAQRIGGTNQEVITGITTDAGGNIYVLGNFSSPSISNSTLSTANNSAGTMDVFVAVFNSTGAILSLKNYGGSGNDFGGGCVFSNSVNSLFISGRFNSILASFGSVNLTNSDGSGLTSDIYLARITSFTTFNWGTSTGSPNSNDASVDLAIDASSNPHFSGTFNNGTTFTTNIASNTLTSIGGQDIIFAKYSSAGVPLWAKNYGTNFAGSNDFSGGISIDASNNIFLSGYSNNSSLVAGTFTLANTGGNDAFIAKTNSTGVFQWVNSINGANDQFIFRNTLDGSGNIYVAGAFSGTNAVVGTTTLTNSNPGTTSDALVIKFNTNGAIQWAATSAGTNNESASGVSCDNNGNVYISGTYASGLTTFGTNTLTLDGTSDAYLAKYGTCLVTTIVGSPTICPGSSATITAFGATNYTWSTGATTQSIVVTPTTTTSYTLTGNTGSCTAVNPTPFVVNLLTASVNAGPDFSLTCGQSQLIPAVTNPLIPTTVVWSPTAGLSNPSIVTPSVNASLGATNYTVTTTFSNGCVAKDEITVTSTVTPPQLCLVSVDSLGINNEIYWDKTLYTKVDSFIVYRETAINVYNRIASLHKSAFSMFIDTTRSVGGSNNGDPKFTAYRYKLQIRDTCGNYSNLNQSLYHQTMFVQDQQNGNFSWNPYAVEASPSPVSNYVLARRDIVTGVTTTVAATTATSVSDPLYSSLVAGNVKWFIEAQGFNCNATAKINGIAILKTRTKSNQTNEKTFPVQGVTENNLSFANVNIYPNPSINNFNIDFSNSVENIEMRLVDVTGKLILTESINGTHHTVNIKNIDHGLYFIQLYKNNKLVVTSKIVVQS
jgi:hypothetical protein